MAEKKKRTKKYIYALGRRKESVATVRLYKGKSEDLLNGKKLKEIYTNPADLRKIYLPFVVTDTESAYYFTAAAKGGGKSGQRDAITLAISRALLKIDDNYRKLLKERKLLTRDPRAKERKKPGLKKARKQEQYSKR
jgi:small subunit ribosomal protein S9